MTAPRPRRAALLAAAVLLPVALQALGLLNPDVPIIDCEERYNAGHALALARHPAALLRLQYRDFCGGCTLVSVLGAGPLALLPPVFATWKLVALGFTGLLGGAGAWLLDRRAGRPAAVAFVALVALMPWNYLRLSLLSWGNHVEVGVLSVAALALVAVPGRRAGAVAGGVCGVGLWTGFSMGPLLVGILVGLCLRRAWHVLPAFGAGLLVAPALWLAQWAAAGTTAFGTIYVAGESTPDLWRAPDKLATLLRPQQVAGLFGLPEPRWGVALGYGWVGSLCVWRWSRRPGGRGWAGTPPRSCLPGSGPTSRSASPWRSRPGRRSRPRRGSGTPPRSTRRRSSCSRRSRADGGGPAGVAPPRRCSRCRSRGGSRRGRRP